MIEDDSQSGFIDDPLDVWNSYRCKSPEHEPPTAICIPQGKIYRHVCPSCKQISYLRPGQIYLSATSGILQC